MKSRLETLEFTLDVLKRIPSKEIHPWGFVTFGLPGVENGDCRYCVIGAVEAVRGGIVKSDSHFLRWTFTQRFGTDLNQEVLKYLESFAYDSLDEDISSAPVRRRTWSQVVAETKRLIKVERKRERAA